MANEEYPFTVFNFLVQLEISNASGLGLSSPLCNAEFAECDGLEMTMEPKTVREGGITRNTSSWLSGHLWQPDTQARHDLEPGSVEMV